ncbi:MULTISPECIES: sensor histidine kinase [unclassified Streptomyces]|uniref:sensor histidine kinase n=1 Tax=unclassified Streptomyces TaxID=2593676 RepID=UPI0008DC8C9D|nr:MULTISPECIES: histidine kinase [unclassified Streptomyces]OII69558.1 two-component sensor histidine kinase [Streptomyces sp. CC77]
MNETTTRRIPAGGRSPELDHARGVLQSLRADLLDDALAYRPLPPLPEDGRLVRRLPHRVRGYAVWLRHAAVASAALLILAGVQDMGLFIGAGLVPAAAVLLTLVRPVAAFWVSLASPLPYAFFGSSGDGWPWPPVVFFAHLVVTTVVAARTRPRTAAWMWLVTALFSAVTGTVLGYGYDSNTAALLFTSALALLTVTLLHVRREAQREVTAERTVTAQERSMRTLLEERTTIARELHDVVAHHMSVVAIQAEAAPYRVENPPPELEQAFATIRENAVAALTELRRVLGVVRAEDYQAPEAPQPTLADLDALLANVRDAGLAVDKTVTGAVRELPPGVELSAYRIVQEALSNVLRHAPGASARVELGYVLGGLGLRVLNGPPRGLVKPSPGAGHGITGMRERVAMLNGELTAEPTEDGGYEVAAFLPVAKEEAP